MGFASKRTSLVKREIDALVPHDPGTYTLRVDDIVAYVGRSDTDLKSRLKDYLDGKERDTITKIRSRYGGNPSTFDFATFDGPADAYDMECHWFHEYRENIVNQIHPDSPNGKDLECRVCGFGDAAIEALKQEIFPAHSFTPEYFPGLFPKKPQKGD